MQEDLRSRVGNGAKTSQKDVRSADDRHCRKGGSRGNDKDTQGRGRNVDDKDTHGGVREANDEDTHRGGSGNVDKCDVAAVDWSQQVAPDSTTSEDEVAKKLKTIEDYLPKKVLYFKNQYLTMTFFIKLLSFKKQFFSKS